MATKNKKAKQEEMMHNHMHMHKGMKIIYLIVGAIILIFAYLQNQQIVGSLILVIVALYLLSKGLRWGMWGYGCGCGCCCEGECNC
ncbi:MAG: hypothetical protein ACREBF_00350 [Candidatus Micrarchaeales archaeon]